MILPIGNDSPRDKFPVVNTALIVINTVVFIYFGWIHGNYEEIVQTYGFVPDQFSLISLTTSMFLHADILHLVGNMLFLGIYGGNVEDKMGRVRYLLFYLASGVVAAGLQTMLSTNYELPNIGASGAIAGVLGAYFTLFPKSKIKFWFGGIFMFRWYSTTFFVPAWLVLGFWFAEQLFGGYLGLSDNPTGGGVAFFAHVGGFLCGLVVMLIFRQMYVVKRTSLLQPALEDFELPPSPSEPLSGKGVKNFKKLIKDTILHKGTPDAIKPYEDMIANSPESTVDPDSLLRIAECYTRRMDNRKAVHTYQRLLKYYPSSDKADNALWFMAQQYKEHLGQPHKARQCMQIIVDAYPLSEWYRPAVFAVEHEGEEVTENENPIKISKTGYIGKQIQYSGPVMLGVFAALGVTFWMSSTLPQRVDTSNRSGGMNTLGNGNTEKPLFSETFDTGKNQGWEVKYPEEKLVGLDNSTFISSPNSLRFSRNQNSPSQIHPAEIISSVIPMDYNQPYKISMDMLCKGTLATHDIEFGHLSMRFQIVSIPYLGTNLKILYMFDGNIRPIEEKKPLSRYFKKDGWNHLEFTVQPSQKTLTITCNQQDWTTVALNSNPTPKIHISSVLPLPQQKSENDTLFYIDNIEIYGTGIKNNPPAFNLFPETAY